MSTPDDSPEIRPCPECGGPRVVHKKIGPEIVAFSTEGAVAWKKQGNEGAFKMVRCILCGYSAFFYYPKKNIP